MKNTWKYVTPLSIIGVILAIYLLYSYLSPSPPGICNLSSTVNCDAVTKGSLATFLGLPVALIGLIGYIAILISGILKNAKLLLAMSSFGMIFCLRMTVLEIFVEKVVCPVCLACQIVMLLLFLLALKINFHKKTGATS